MAPLPRRARVRAARLLLALAALLLLLPTSACEEEPTLGELVTQTSGQKIALVSYSVNYLMYSLEGYEMEPLMVWLLDNAEACLGRHWTVQPASAFVPSWGYQEQRGDPMSVELPSFDGQSMGVFADDRDQLVKAQLSPERARALAEASGTELVAVVYIEWATASEGFSFKALAKVVLSIYDANGQLIYTKRRDQKGFEKLELVPYQSVFTEESMIQWVEASDAGLDMLLRAG